MKQAYVVKQNDSQDCGVCALLSIVKYYNGYIPIEKLRLDTNTNKEGTTAYQIINTAKKYGFDALGIKSETITQQDIVLPAIAHLRYENGLEHFVVIYKITNKAIIVMDPARGYQKLKPEVFNQLWTKVLLTLVPNTKIVNYQKINKLSQLGYELVKQEKQVIIKTLLITLFITIIALVTSYYYQYGIALIKEQNIRKLYFASGLFIILLIIKVLGNYLRQKWRIYLDARLDTNLTIPFLQHLILLPLNSIKSRTTGEITTRYHDLLNIKDIISEIMSSVFFDILLSGFIFLILFNINNQLFYVLCLLLIIYLLIGLIVSPHLYRKIINNLDLETELNSSLIEKINGLISIKNNQGEKREIQELKQQKYNLLDNEIKFQRYLARYQYSQSLLTEIGLGLITCWGFILIFKQQLSIGNLLTFNTILIYLFEPLQNLINLLPRYYYLKAAFNRVNDLWALPVPTINEVNPQFKAGMITFTKVSYNYHNLQPIFKNLSFAIPQAKHIMLCGKSGSGKSTICKLLVGDEVDYQGRIMIGSINLKDYCPTVLKTNIAYLSQAETIFTDTLLNNIIRYSTYDQERLAQVIKICQLQELIDQKPLRLATLLFNEGTNFSGGERQRILLARTLMRDCSIYILDEALSEVPATLEAQIINNIRVTYKDKTIIYITHRAHQKLFDQVIKLN